MKQMIMFLALVIILLAALVACNESDYNTTYDSDTSSSSSSTHITIYTDTGFHGNSWEYEDSHHYYYRCTRDKSWYSQTVYRNGRRLRVKSYTYVKHCTIMR